MSEVPSQSQQSPPPDDEAIAQQQNPAHDQSAFK